MDNLMTGQTPATAPETGQVAGRLEQRTGEDLFEFALRSLKAQVWDECTDAHHRAAGAQQVAFAHPRNPYRDHPEDTAPVPATVPTAACPRCGQNLTAAYDDGIPFWECDHCGADFSEHQVAHHQAHPRVVPSNTGTVSPETGRDLHR